MLTAAGRAEEAKVYRDRANAVRQAINAKMWDDEAGYYWDLDGRAERRIKVLTPSGPFLDPVPGAKCGDQ